MNTSTGQLLRSAATEWLIDEAGEPLKLQVFSGSLGDASRWEGIDTAYGSLLIDASGFALGSWEVFFCGQSSNDFDWLIPDCLELCADGAGNFWVLELKPGHAAGAVWFVCHDPPTVHLVSETLHRFVEEVIDGHRPQPTILNNRSMSSFDDAMAVWASAKRPAPAPAFRSSPDSALAQFAASVPDSFGILDFRHAIPGDGFVIDGVDGMHAARCDPAAPRLKACSLARSIESLE